jgi:hypothetical protein
MIQKVGYAQNTITPSLDRPVFLAGFGQNRPAETIHDPLFVRALALAADQTRLVLCSLDLIGFFSLDVQDVIQRVHEKSPGAHIIIASTHTHHGPDTMGLWGPDSRTRGVDAAYLSELKSKIVAVVLLALEKLKPCSYYKFTSVHVPGIVKNARNPEIMDDELTVLQFMDEDKKTLASLFNFPCHPEVLWEHNPHITADYPASLRSTVEAATGAPCIFFSGALGGMMTPDVRDHSFEEAEAMGKALAVSGLAALNTISPQSLPALQIKRMPIQIKLTNILFKLAIRRLLLPEPRNQKGWVTSETNLIKLGGLWLATVPGELLPKLGLQLKAAMISAGARVTGVVGLANDELGYLLPAEDFRYPINPIRPGKHYEETMSLSKDAGTMVVDGILKILAKE